jgi:hypothetical protein
MGLWTEGDYLKRLEQVNDPFSFGGLSGNARVTYSPGYVTHYLRQYKNVVACAGVNQWQMNAPPKSDTNFTQCFGEEFPPDAVVLKTSWYQGGSTGKVDTTADTLKKRLSGELENGGWTPNNRLTMVPSGHRSHKDAGTYDGPNNIYTVRVPGSINEWGLQALHIMTKELRHWVWVTIWWSPDPDTDFGQDRSDDIKALGEPWQNYKMQIVVDYEEKDTDPRGGFDGTLGDALEATHSAISYGSNPFLEKKDHNAQSNCIGCHQHAGDNSAFDELLTNETRFPEHTRTKIRTSFVADYSWALTTPPSAATNQDRFLDMISKRVELYKDSDRKTLGLGPDQSADAGAPTEEDPDAGE